MYVYPVRTDSAPSWRVVVKPWVQKTKVRNTSNTHSHEHARSSTHSRTHRPTHPRTHRPTHPRRTTAIQQSTAADALIQTELLTLGFPCFYDSPPPRGASRPVPGRAPLHALRSPSWARHPLCAGDREGLQCGWDVAPQRGRVRPSGARVCFLGV